MKATLSEMLVINSIAYLAGQGMNVPDLSGHINFFCCTPPFLCYKSSLKNAKFSGFLLSQRSFGSYVQSIPEKMKMIKV